MDSTPPPIVTHRTAQPGAIHTRALVLFSGGQDSTACLAYALSKFAHVETVGFDYGQRHSIELVQRSVVIKELRQTFPSMGRQAGRRPYAGPGRAGQG